VRLRRAITWTIAVTALVVLLAAGLIVLAVKRVPARYRPLTLSAQQKQLAKNRFDRAIQAFLAVTSHVGTVDPRRPATSPAPREGALELTADELNFFLAALPDEAIAALWRIGLRDPALSVDDGRLTLYAYWSRYDAVIAVDLAAVFADDQSMTLNLLGARLGGMPVPNRVFIRHRDEILGQLRDHVRDLSGRRGEHFGPAPASDLGRAGKQLIDAAEGIPVRLDVHGVWGHARVRNIRLVKDKVIIEVVSLLGRTP